jgi:hypothetical protein
MNLRVGELESGKAENWASRRQLLESELRLAGTVLADGNVPSAPGNAARPSISGGWGFVEACRRDAGGPRLTGETPVPLRVDLCLAKSSSTRRLQL